ncbi:hypothetical protein LCUW1_00029020, partial [Lactobacillus casei]|nr:hypothetical protein [Lacticaseibacillus casei]
MSLLSQGVWTHPHTQNYTPTYPKLHTHIPKIT